MLSHTTGKGSVFNYATAMARLDNDAELFREMVQFFREDSPPLLQQIRDGLKEKNPQQVERAAHSLKGLSATFDAHPAVDAARRLEEMARNGDLHDAPAIEQILDREVAQLIDALTNFQP